MMCTRCGKRPAVVFITTMQGNETRDERLCHVCAKELGIPQVAEYFKEMGIDEEMFEDGLSLGLDGDDDTDDDDEHVGGFHPGGASTLPQFLQNLFKVEPAPPAAQNRFFKQEQSDGKDTRESSGSAENSRKKEEKKQKKDKKRKFLDAFCTNLTAKAKNGELDKIVGRAKEIERVTQILSRRAKNNPCLIGEPGVGKTAIAEGIAQILISGDAPYRLIGKELYLLDLTVLIAGTQFRGQFESRVKSLIEEIKELGNIILFIDEVHTLVGTGDSDGAMNAANMFKPALARGDMQVIGATTFGEYRKHIEKDGALERRFQPVVVNEPTLDETFELLKGVKGYYEKHHKVKVTDRILRDCAVLSERYINDRFLPDKAIDLLDEAAACVSIKNKDLSEYERLIAENDRLVKEESEIVSSKSGIDYEKLSQVKTKFAQNAERIIELKPVVEEIYIGEEDLSQVIELWTGIPANKIMETEFKKIGKLESVLKSKIIGQDEACGLVAAAIRRSRVQLSARRRPASFIFVGPTGVGKTELVKVLGAEMFDSIEPLIRLDMSEYMEKHSVSRIIGSPPGYVGYDEAGQLTEKVRRRPYSVILLDEIEKAHPDVMNVLLQILDEGKVNDSHGRSVNFENTVIAMTSNAGSGDKSSGVGFGKTAGDISKEKAMKSLKEFLRPEFLARIDEVVVFSPLDRESLSKISALMLEEMRSPLGEKEIGLEVEKDVYDYLAEKVMEGEAKFGGRDLRRIIRKEIEDPVASLIIDRAATREEDKITQVRIVVIDDTAVKLGRRLSVNAGDRTS